MRDDRLCPANAWASTTKSFGGSGTVLVHDGPRAKALNITLSQVQRTVLTPAQWDFARNLLDRWAGLMPDERARLANAFFDKVQPSVPLSGNQPVAMLATMQLERLKRLVG